MAYIDRSIGKKPNIGVMAIVAVTEAALIVAVVNGLGITIGPRDKDDRIIAFPVPQPTPTATPEAIETPKPDNRLPDPQPVPVPPRPPIGGSGPQVPPSPVPSPIPSPTADPLPPLPTPSPVALARAAVPRGNPGAWVSDNDYPTPDIRAGHQGRVGFSLAIGSDGRVTGCQITASSGHTGLDTATCALISRRARFTPAMGSDGQPRAGSYSGSIRWVIPD